MIGLYLEPVSHQVLLEFGQSMHYGQHLFVIYGVMSLILSEFATLKRDWVTTLHQYNSYPNSRSITLQDKGLSEIREC